MTTQACSATSRRPWWMILSTNEIAYPELQRGVIVLWPGRGLYVVIGRQGIDSLSMEGVERTPYVDNRGGIVAPAWRVAKVPVPELATVLTARAILSVHPE
jgi:hypothetical protein